MCIYNTTQYQQDLISVIAINIFYTTLGGLALLGTYLFCLGVSIPILPTTNTILNTRM